MSPPLRVFEHCPACGWRGVREYPGPLGGPCPHCGAAVPEAQPQCPQDHWVVRLIARALLRARDAAPCGADGSWGGLTAQGTSLCERVWAASSAERWHRTGIGALAGHLITAARCRSQANNTRHAAAFKRARRIMLHNLDDFAQLCRKRGLP